MGQHLPSGGPKAARRVQSRLDTHPAHIGEEGMEPSLGKNVMKGFYHPGSSK